MSNSSNAASSRFSITEAKVHFAYLFERYASIPGACVCFLVLVVSGVAACFSRSRRCLDRVSFRLVVYALISRVCFGITYAITPDSPGPRCDFAAFITNIFVCYSAFVTTCIAINLQLVVVHHINGHRMEKYYLIVPMLLVIAFSVPPYALRQFGWDESASVCWYRNPHPTSRLHWIIATQSFPLALAAAIETMCSCTLLMYMYLVWRGTRPFFMSFISSSIRSTSGTSESNPSHVDRQQPSMNIAQHPPYRKAILRIVLYPIVSLLVNTLTTALDLNGTIRGVNTPQGYRLLILDISVVGIRTLPYGLLAAFDPALSNALRELFGKNTSGPARVSTTSRAPTGFVSENRQRTRTLSNPSPQTTATDGAEAQSQSNMELTSVGEDEISNVVGEHTNEVNIIIVTEKTGQLEELEGDRQNDCELDFLDIGRQL